MSQIEKLAHPFNSVYTKLFSTFDKNVISLCQFYTGYLPLQYMLYLRMICFFDALCVCYQMKNLLPDYFLSGLVRMNITLCVRSIILWQLTLTTPVSVKFGLLLRHYVMCNKLNP